jgi:hypothetical protein
MKTRKLVSMREALESPDYFGALLADDSWRGWRILLIAIMGEPLYADERAVFKELTGRDHAPGEPAEEFWGVVGRRGGKTRAMAVLASYLAVCIDYRAILAPGERGLLPIMAASTLQAQQAFNFTAGMFETAPNLKGLVTAQTADTLTLSTGVEIQVRPASYRTIRGITAIGAVADEIAFWRSDDSANPDKEILNALRPSLATTGGLLAAISSPHAKRGELYATYRRHFGPSGHPRILVAKAASRTLNPSLSQRVVDRAYEEDAVSAAAEYGAEFRGDIEIFITREAVEACVTRDLTVRAPLSAVSYVGFCDPSGGSSDSMTMAIAHREGQTAVLDYVGERKAPFSPASVVQEFAAVFKSYHCHTIRGDRYAGEWPAESFAAHGIKYLPAEKTRSELYVDLLPLVNSKRADLLDNVRMIVQLVGLERRTTRAGKDSVDHAPGAHDDIANAVAGAVVMASAARQPMVVSDKFLAASRQPTWQRMHRSKMRPNVFTGSASNFYGT